jgi:hypothetical protein
MDRQGEAYSQYSQLFKNVSKIQKGNYIEGKEERGIKQDRWELNVGRNSL